MKPVIYLCETENRKAFVTNILGKVKSDFLSHNKVLVKPNIVSQEAYPTTTHPEVLAAVLDFLIDCECRIVVADGPAVDAGDSRKVLSRHQLNEVCNERGIELQNLHKHGFRRVRTGSMSLNISNLAFDCDYIISLPVLKPHKYCKITGALKNQFGFIRNRDRILMHAKLKSLSRGIAEVNTVVRPNLFIIDAIKTYNFAHEIRHGGQEVKLGYLLAGRDPVALDSLGLDLLKKNEIRLRDEQPLDIDYLLHAVQLGLGSIEYEIEQVSINEC